MGIRSRLKHRVRSLLGSPRPATPPAPAARAAPPPPGEQVPPEPPVEATAVAPAPPPAATEPAAVPADKAAWHFERTRRAVLRFIEDHDDVSDLAAMHDYSERRYFIGHKRFSDLMETLLDEHFIQYDHSTGVARLTERGRSHAHLPMPPKPKKKEATE